MYRQSASQMSLPFAGWCATRCTQAISSASTGPRAVACTPRTGTDTTRVRRSSAGIARANSWTLLMRQCRSRRCTAPRSSAVIQSCCPTTTHADGPLRPASDAPAALASTRTGPGRSSSRPFLSRPQPGDYANEQAPDSHSAAGRVGPRSSRRAGDPDPRDRRPCSPPAHRALDPWRARGVHETSHAFGVESRLGKDQDMPTLGHGPTHLLGRPANERRVAQQRRAHPADIRFRAPRTYRLLRLCGLFQFRAHSLHPFYG